MEEGIRWRLGEEVPRLLNETFEKEAVGTFRARMKDIYGDEGEPTLTYIERGLKKLGDEFSSQIPYGREMMDRAMHLKSFLEEKFVPEQNNLVSVEEAGYSFRVMPEVELLFDDHDCVNSLVLVFYVAFAGKEDRLPEEKVWKEIVKRSFFALDMQRVESQIYVWNDDLRSDTNVERRKYDVYSLLYDDAVAFLSKEEKARWIERYNLPERAVVDETTKIEDADVYEFDRMSASFNDDASDVLTNRFSESFFFSMDRATMGHPILNPNGMHDVPKRLKVDHRVGHPELLKWKERGKECYIENMLDECGIKIKSDATNVELMSDPFGFFEDCLGSDKINKHFGKNVKDEDSTVLSSYNANDSKRVMGDIGERKKTSRGSGAKGKDAETVTHKKQSNIFSFFTSKQRQQQQTSDEPVEPPTPTRSKMDALRDARASFVKKHRHFMCDEFDGKRSDKCAWLPSLKELSTLSDYKGNKILLHHEWLLKAFGSELNRVCFDPSSRRYASNDPRRVDLSTLSDHVKVYRCVINTNIWPFHYRSYVKTQPKIPVDEDRIVRETIRFGYVFDYSPVDLFDKEKLKSDMKTVESKMKAKRKEGSDALYSESFDDLLNERENITLFSNLNFEKYAIFGAELRTPDFFKSFLNVTKNDFDERVKRVVKDEIKKNATFARSLSSATTSRSIDDRDTEAVESDDEEPRIKREPTPSPSRTQNKRKRDSSKSRVGVEKNVKRSKK